MVSTAGTDFTGQASLMTSCTRQGQRNGNIDILDEIDVNRLATGFGPSGPLFKVVHKGLFVGMRYPVSHNSVDNSVPSFCGSAVRAQRSLMSAAVYVPPLSSLASDAGGYRDASQSPLATLSDQGSPSTHASHRQSLGVDRRVADGAAPGNTASPSLPTVAARPV